MSLLFFLVASMIAATEASPVTLTELRSISNRLSTQSINANPSAGIPTLVSTMVRMT